MLKIPRFPELPIPLPWHPPLKRELLRLGMHFTIPFPSGTAHKSSFILKSFRIAKNAYSLNSRFAHPLEANFVSGSGISGCFVPMKEFLETATIDGYYPHRSDSREEQYKIHILYEKEHQLPPLSQQMLDAIAWEGWFSLEELRVGKSATPALPLKDAIAKLERQGARFIQTRSGFNGLNEWQPYGSQQNLFLYEIAEEHVIEHLNPNSAIAHSGVKPGAWRWSKEERYSYVPTAERVHIHQEKDSWGLEQVSISLDGVTLGKWSCSRAVQERYGEWYGNQLCLDLGLPRLAGGYRYECKCKIQKEVAPYMIYIEDNHDG